MKAQSKQINTVINYFQEILRSPNKFKKSYQRQQQPVETFLSVDPKFNSKKV